MSKATQHVPAVGDRVSVWWKRSKEWIRGTVSNVELRIGYLLTLTYS